MHLPKLLHGHFYLLSPGGLELLLAGTFGGGLRPCLVAGCKVFERESFYIWSTKHRLIIKLITELVCKSRDESNEPNESVIRGCYCSITVAILYLIMA